MLVFRCLADFFEPTLTSLKAYSLIWASPYYAWHLLKLKRIAVQILISQENKLCAFRVPESCKKCFCADE